jgi:hypothetical protein
VDGAAHRVFGPRCGHGLLRLLDLPLAEVYAILFAAPMLITVLSIPILGERVGLHRWGAVIVGLIGVLVVLRPGASELNLGHAAALTASIGSSLVAVIIRKIGRDERSAVLLLYPMMANALVMGAILPFVYVPVEGIHFAMFAAMSALGFAGGLLIIAAYKSADEHAARHRHGEGRPEPAAREDQRQEAAEGRDRGADDVAARPHHHIGHGRAVAAARGGVFLQAGQDDDRGVDRHADGADHPDDRVDPNGIVEHRQRQQAEARRQGADDERHRRRGGRSGTSPRWPRSTA